MSHRRLRTVELWDGSTVFCHGFLDGLPVWRWGTAPADLVTRRQLREQRLRRCRGQEPVGLLVFRKRGCGEQIAELFRIDQAVPSRPLSPRWRASIEAMCRAHRTCRACGRDTGRWLPTSTWRCDDCCARTGDYGTPAAA